MKTKRILLAAYRSRTPVLLWGPPGVGKTAMLEALAQELGLELIRPHVRAPEDIALPVARPDGGVEIVPVGEFVRAARTERAVVFLDEITTLPGAVQAAALRFLDSGVVGDLRIPPSVWRVAAANPPELAAGGWDLEAPTANRLTHVEFQPDPMEWARDFVDYWGRPPVVGDLDPATWAQARGLVAAFIRARPHLLLQVPKEAAARGKAWPSPRTWDMASRHLAAATAPGEGAPGARLDRDLATILVAGAVGEPAALEFAHWLQELDLPDPEAVLANPQSLRLPCRGDLVYAVLTAVVQAALHRLNRARWDAAWEVMVRAADQGYADIAAVAAGLLVRNRPPQYPVEKAARFAGVLFPGRREA